MRRVLLRTLALIAAELVLVGGAHALLLAWFADGEVASVLFTGGHDVSPATLVGAALFFLTRLTLYLVLPGLVLAQLALAATAKRKGAR